MILVINTRNRPLRPREWSTRGRVLPFQGGGVCGDADPGRCPELMSDCAFGAGESHQPE